MTATVCDELKALDSPRGALLMAVVSVKNFHCLCYHYSLLMSFPTQVERALSFWTSGINNMKELDGKFSKFSEKVWGPQSVSYIPSIKQLSPRRWDKILSAARSALAASSARIPVPVEIGTSSPGPSSDVRGSLFEEDSEPDL